MRLIAVSQCLLLLFFSLEASSSFPPRPTLEDYQKRFLETSAIRSTQPTVDIGEMKDPIRRVFNPIEYGGDPSGENDSTDAFLKVLNDAFKVQSGLVLLPGVNDLGGVLIDLVGGNYKISQPLRFPVSGGGNLLMQGGTLRASQTFPPNRHLIELWAPNSQKMKKTDIIMQTKNFSYTKVADNVGIYYEDITFRDLLLDSGFRGGGIFIIDSARIRINNCYITHFTTEGILVQRGHETYISSSFLGQNITIGGDTNERYFSGTAIDLASNDNAITDVAIFSAAVGVVVRGQANIITGVHCYNKATYWGGIGILVKLPGLSQTRIDNCYLDYNAIVLEDPVQVHVTNGFFLGGGNVVLKSIKGRISGLNIVDNMFSGDPKNMVPIVKLEGEFNNIDQVVIDRNNANGMGLKSTIGKLSVGGNGTKWVLDFSSILIFPKKVNHVQYSFYVRGGSSFPIHAVTDIMNNVVTVESDKGVDGVVSMVVDQENMMGETNHFM